MLSAVSFHHVLGESYNSFCYRRQEKKDAHPFPSPPGRGALIHLSPLLRSVRNGPSGGLQPLASNTTPGALHVNAGLCTQHLFDVALQPRCGRYRGAGRSGWTHRSPPSLPPPRSFLSASVGSLVTLRELKAHLRTPPSPRQPSDPTALAEPHHRQMARALEPRDPTALAEPHREQVARALERAVPARSRGAAARLPLP